MKKFLLLISLFTSYAVKAQYYWNFESTTVTSTNNASPSITVSPVTLHNNNGTTDLLVDGSSSGYAGASGGKAGAASAKEGGFHKDNSTYFQVTLTPAAGNSIVLSGISFGSKSSGIGPTNWTVRSSIVTNANGPYGEDFGSGTLNTNTWEQESAVFSLVGEANQAVTLRIYGFNFTIPPTSNQINWLIDDLKLHTDIQTLPVKLKSFEAQELISSIKLNWKTLMEENTRDFEILRSTDGKTFTSIGKVLAAGSSKTEKAYSFIDFTPHSGSNYYQLRQNDRDGKSAKSKIITAKFNVSKTDIRLSSTRQGVQLVIYSAEDTEGRLTLTNLSGNALAKESVKLQKGYNTINLTGNYGSSILIASLSTPAESISRKFFVQ